MQPKHWLLIGGILLIVAAVLGIVSSDALGGCQCHHKTIGGPVALASKETPVLQYVAAVTGLLGAISTVLSGIIKLIKVLRARK